MEAYRRGATKTPRFPMSVEVNGEEIGRDLPSNMGRSRTDTR
ncbi:hypothetical protein ABGB12_28700 [Actinocorallia sp. B10E7]